MNRLGRTFNDTFILVNKVPEPVEFPAWLEWLKEHEPDRRVALTKVGRDCEVSTIFLGLNHQYGDGPPLLFETMVFGGALDETQRRYSTWDEAMDGHNEMVEFVRKSQRFDGMRILQAICRLFGF